MSSAIQRVLKQKRPFRSIEEEVFVGLQIAADRLMEPWAAFLKETADLSHVQYNVLRILRGAGEEGLWAGEIGERLITRSPDVTRLIDRLEKRKLVKRRQDPADRRAVRVQITDLGREEITSIDQRSRTLLQSYLQRLSPGHIEALRDELDVLIDVLDRS